MNIVAYDLKGNPLYDDPKVGPPVRTTVGTSRYLLNHQLSDVVNDTSGRAFCGPTAVAAITGVAISVVRDAYRSVRHGPNWHLTLDHTPRITGTYWHETKRVLEKFGFEGEWENVSGSPTLAAFTDAMSASSRRDPRAIFVTRHVVAVSGAQFCDTFSRGKIVDLDEAPGRRKRVKRSLRLTRYSPPLVLLGYRLRRDP